MSIYAYQEERRQLLQTRNGRTQDERLRVMVVDLKVAKKQIYNWMGNGAGSVHYFPLSSAKQKPRGGGKRI